MCNGFHTYHDDGVHDAVHGDHHGDHDDAHDDDPVHRIFLSWQHAQFLRSSRSCASSILKRMFFRCLRTPILVSSDLDKLLVHTHSASFVCFGWIHNFLLNSISFRHSGLKHDQEKVIFLHYFPFLQSWFQKLILKLIFKLQFLYFLFPFTKIGLSHPKII